MAVLQMQKISICALKKDRKAVLEKLQRISIHTPAKGVTAILPNFRLYIL